MKTTLHSLAAIALLAVANHAAAQENAAAAPTFRTWTSTSGTKIEAQFVLSSNEKITLRTKEGRVITIRSDQLSEGDLEWIAKRMPADASPAGASPATTSSADLERLTEILEKALSGSLDNAERMEAEKIFATFLPAKGANDEAVDWEVSLPPSADAANQRTSVLMTVDMHAKDTNDRIVWMHIVWYPKKPDSFGTEKLGRYPVMRAPDRHVFVLVGRTEVRAVEDHQSYKSDAKLETLFKLLNLEAIKKL